MSENTNWMVVYRQGKARSVKVARYWLTWQEAYEVAGEILKVNENLNNKADHFQAWYTTDDATSVIDEESAFARAGRKAVDWENVPRLPIKRGE